MKHLILAGLALFAPTGVASAATVVLDYSYDTSLFFSTTTDNGLKARATVEAAAKYFSDILEDSLARVEKPADYISTAPGGPPATYSWDWLLQFDNPSTGGLVSISNPVVPADVYRIYVGARNLTGSTLGVGGPGGYNSNSGGGYYFQWQADEIEAINADFAALLDSRGEPAGEFGRWGGALTFDSVGTTWNYDHTVAPSGGQNDLFSVALHEIGHALGLGTSNVFKDLASGGFFYGAAATAANGGTNPRVTSDEGHWLEGTNSTVFGGAASQEAAMDPSITTGTRKLWTTLDAAALADIGWEVATPGLPGDYNSDGLVNAADYTVWRDNAGTPSAVGSYAEWKANYGSSSSSNGVAVPEPAGVLIALMGLGTTLGRRC